MTETQTQAAEAGQEEISKRRLKAWLRLLGVTRRTEGRLREFLRTRHDTTLPRFDIMAALHRRRAPLSMGELSRLLLVSNGNVTAVVDRLEKDGLVTRQVSETDRRTIWVSLTPEGLRQFERQAAEHEAEVSACFEALTPAELEVLTRLLQRLQPPQK